MAYSSLSLFLIYIYFFSLSLSRVFFSLPSTWCRFYCYFRGRRGGAFDILFGFPPLVFIISSTRRKGRKRKKRLGTTAMWTRTSCRNLPHSKTLPSLYVFGFSFFCCRGSDSVCGLLLYLFVQHKIRRMDRERIASRWCRARRTSAQSVDNSELRSLKKQSFQIVIAVVRKLIIEGESDIPSMQCSPIKTC